VPKGNPLREVALGLCRQVGQPGDDKFVYELDSQNRVRELGKHYPGFTGADVLHSFLCSTTRAIKAHLRHKDSRVIYPGRDVWALEVMSQRRGVPSVYDPRISREIKSHGPAYKEIIDAWGIPDWGKALAFDSGYAGTVPRAIGRVAGVHEINIVMLSAVDTHLQVFPGHTGSRAKALALEYLAKYRKRCLVKDKTPTQPLADLEEFIKAALLTIWIWHHVSPRRLPSWQKEHIRKQKKRGSINISAGNSGVVWAPASQWAASSLTSTNVPVIQTATTATTPIHVFASNTAGTTASVIDPWAFNNTFNLSTGASVTGGLI
jgi:hypothetical protein